MSDQSEHKSENRGSDLLGLFLSGIGGLFFVSILLSFGEREPKDVIWTTPVVGLIEGLGRSAGLLLSAGLALAGTAVFLGRRGGLAGRNLFCLFGGALGLALLLGGVIPSGAPGGLLGRALPDLLPGLPGRLLGALIGLCVTGAAVLALLPARSERRGARKPLERAELAPSLESRHGGEGVSAAEAEALTPAARVRAPSVPPPSAPPPSAPPPSYPRDVRIEGRVPAGARPLESGLRAAPRATPTSPVAELRREERSAYGPPVLSPVPPRGGSSVAEARPIENGGNGPVQPSWERAGRAAVEPAEPWESPSLVRVDEEPAPGSPSDLDSPAAPLHASIVTAEPEPDVLVPVERKPARSRARAKPARAASRAAESAEPPVAEASALPEAAEAARKVEPPAWEQVGLFDETSEATSIHAPERASALASETTLDPDVEATDEEELAAGTPEEAAYGDDDLVDDDDEEDEDDDEDDDDDEDEDEDDEEEDDDEDEEDDDVDDGDLADIEFKLAEVEIVAADGAREPAAEPDAAPEPVRAPAALARAAQEPAPAFARLDFEQLVLEAGCIVIDQSRVAVSMLQRSFQIDFDQACAVLDQLQERGLIGPYMGGRTRDILLTREEWVAQAHVV